MRNRTRVIILAAILLVAASLACRTGTTEPRSTETPVPTRSLRRNPTATPRPTDVTERAGATWTRPADGMEMIFVPAGEFQMGSTDDEVDNALDLCSQHFEGCEREQFADEQPAHTVRLDPFWIDRTEVTNAQYGLCVAQGTCQESRDDFWQHSWQDPGYADDSDLYAPDHSVVGVDWYSATIYCEWAGARLPTEAEWEYAARGPERLAFPWGGSFSGTRLNFCDLNCAVDWRVLEDNDGHRYTAPVGSYADGASWCEAVDMAGNVWEWVSDWYGEYPSERQVNPTGPSSGEYRLVRGGSYLLLPDFTRTATRGKLEPDGSRSSIGFRCARSSD